MTLDLSKIAAQVGAMGSNAAQRAKERSLLIPELLALLARHADDASLRDKAGEAFRFGWGGAIPASEPLDYALDPPSLPNRITLVAADGSQVYPDRHSLTLYYMINIGSIVLRLGTGEKPIAETTPEVYFDDEQLYGEDEYPVSAQVINAQRAVQEMRRLADIAVEEAKQAPTVALADGNIALRVKQEGIPADKRDKLERDYVAQLNALRAGQVATSGYISRPGATSVVRLMQLARDCPPERIAEFVKNNTIRPFGGIGDTPVFEALLDPGQRSAVFRLATQWGKPYQVTGHAIHFFYLNVGTPLRAVVARVEVPEWVASDGEKLGLVHSAIVDQCHITDIAYPYVLTRADELAVITTSEKASFERMIGVEMLRHGVESGPSQKAATKTIARYGKKR